MFVFMTPTPRESTYQKKLDVKTFLFSSSNRETDTKMQWSEKPSKKTALTCPKTATKI